MLKNFSEYLKTEAGRLFQYVVAAFGLIVLSLVWQMFLPIRNVPSCAPEDARLMFEISFFCGFEGWEVFARVGMLLLGLFYCVNPIAAVLMGFANERDMLRDQQLQNDMNDSNARVNAWAAMAMGWVVLMTPYTYLPNYLANLLFRLPLAFIWAVVFTIILVRFQLGIKTVGKYVEQFRLPKNEAAAVWTGVAMVLAAWLVVST